MKPAYIFYNFSISIKEIKQAVVNFVLDERSKTQEILEFSTHIWDRRRRDQLQKIKGKQIKIQSLLSALKEFQYFIKESQQRKRIFDLWSKFCLPFTDKSKKKNRGIHKFTDQGFKIQVAIKTNNEQMDNRTTEEKLKILRERLTEEGKIQKNKWLRQNRYIELEKIYTAGVK